MVHRYESNDEALDPAYAGRFAGAPIPKNRMPDGESLSGAVYRMIHDELLLDGSSRLNMATFVTTWMEPEAEKLMAETFDKSAADSSNSAPADGGANAARDTQNCSHQSRSSGTRVPIRPTSKWLHIWES